MEPKPKYLRQKTTGRIYAYSDILATRKDMTPVEEEKPQAPVIDIKPAEPASDLTPEVKPAPAVAYTASGVKKGQKKEGK